MKPTIAAPSCLAIALTLAAPGWGDSSTAASGSGAGAGAAGTAGATSAGGAAGSAGAAGVTSGGSGGRRGSGGAGATGGADETGDAGGGDAARARDDLRDGVRGGRRDMRRGDAGRELAGDDRSFHQASVSAFCLNTTHVTQAAYAACVAAGAWTPPAMDQAPEQRGDSPVRYIPWAQASGYRAWAGKAPDRGGARARDARHRRPRLPSGQRAAGLRPGERRARRRALRPDERRHRDRARRRAPERRAGGSTRATSPRRTSGSASRAP
jgi:hypothetical protein